MGFEISRLAPRAAAQEAIDDRVQPAAGNPASLYGRDSTQGVYVRDSAVAVEKFALAERLEHLKEWDKSADVYMEILQGYADRVVPSQVDDENQIYQYTSVAAAVQERLARWPDEGLRVYRNRYEAAAEALLDSAGEDPGKLHRVVSLYFVTDSAKQAALRLIDIYLESADFPAAAWLGDRLLEWHPGLEDDRPRTLFRTAIAYHLSGEADRAQGKLTELKDQFPAATGTVRGEAVNLAESLAVELAQTAPPTVRVASSESWPIAFGSPDRARVPAVSAGFGARLFSVEMTESMGRTPTAVRRQLEQINESERKGGAMTGVFPVVDRGEMFFQDNARVYAVSLESGTPLPGWTETYTAQRNGQYSINAWSTPRGQQCTITLTDDSVYAVMGQADLAAATITGTMSPRGETRLVCLDRRTGKEKWVASSRTLPPEAGLARILDFSGSPVVVGDTVYVMGRGGKGMQFEDAYVLAFDAATGNSKWICYLASANTGWMDFSDFGGMFGQRVSHLAYWGGRLYAITNLGALSAIDAHDGTIVWLNLYPRDIPEPNRLMGFHPAWNQRARLRAARAAGGGTGSGIKPWTFNPVMVSGGNVFVVPSDGLHVLVYDAATGIEKMRIALSEFDDADTLLGVIDDRLVLAAAKTVFCINWPAYDADRGVEGNLFWRRSFAKAGFPDDAIQGRAFVTRDAVIVPTAWALHRISLKDGRVEASYPDRAEWSEEEGPGNVLVLQDRLIVSTPQRVNVYTDLRLAMEKLDAEVAAAPQQPEPRLRYAEIMSVAGKWDVALAKLDEAMQLVGGAGSGTSTPARDRLFTDALTFAQRVAKDGSEASVSQASAFFDRAAAAAATPAQHVNYRLTRAKVMKGQLAPDAELKLYQEILADAAMRQVPVLTGESGGGPGSARPAGAIAERAITELIARAGRAIYEPFEAMAAERLQAAQAENDPAALLAITQEYPNAQLAPRALAAAAQAYESAGENRLAAQVLRQLLFRYPDSPDRARLIESLARNYLAMPNRIDVAIARLSQAASRMPGARLTQPLKLPDGEVIENATFADAVATLRKLKERSAAAALPDMRLAPLDPANWKPGQGKFRPESPDSVVSGVSVLVSPLMNFARHDRVVGFSPERGLMVWKPGKTEPLFTSDALESAPKGIAWNESHLIAWNETNLAVLDAATGQTRWHTPLASLPSVEVVTPPAGVLDVADAADDDEAGLDGAEVPRAQQILRQRAELEARLNARRFNVQLQIQQRGAPVEAAAAAAVPAGPEQVAHVRPLGDRVVFSTSTGRIVALALDDGSILWQLRPDERGATHLVASDDFVVARFDDDVRVRLLVLDALSGQPLSRRTDSNEDGAGRVPINLELAPDGTLVWITPDRLYGKDLFEPGDRVTFEEPAQPRGGGAPTFIGATGLGHLQICDGKIFVLSDNGSYVRAYSLENGKPLRHHNNEMFFATGQEPGSASPLVRIVGRKLYVASSQSMKSYDLLNPAFNWSTQFSQLTAVRPRDLIVTQDYLVVVSEPVGATGGGARARRAGGGRPDLGGAGAAPAGTTTVQLQPFSRALLDEEGRESGLLEQPHTITDPATLLAWQPVNGGFYYLAGDQKLHFLEGAEE